MTSESFTKTQKIGLGFLFLVFIGILVLFLNCYLSTRGLGLFDCLGWLILLSVVVIMMLGCYLKDWSRLLKITIGVFPLLFIGTSLWWCWFTVQGLEFLICLRRTLILLVVAGITLVYYLIKWMRSSHTKKPKNNKE